MTADRPAAEPVAGPTTPTTQARRPARWKRVLTVLLAVLLCVMAFVSTVLGFISLISGVRCLDGHKSYFCTEGGWGVAIWLPMVGGPLVAVGCAVAALMSRRSGLAWAVTGVAGVVALWAMTDILTDGWTLRLWW